MNIIGREWEINKFNELYNSDKAELAVVYGRRRVGKTFLIDEALHGKITFRHAGLSPIECADKQNMLKKQLKHFYNSLLLHGMKKSHVPQSWLEAFFMLEMHLQYIDKGERLVVFLDELPWMDTPRSGFMTAFEGFWNTWACHRHNLMLVVCGSATSWVQDKLIANHGGLYGRVTCPMKLSPFTLYECERFFASKGVKLSRYDIVQSYMIFGGIPYYLDFFQRGMSLDQNVNRILFGKNPLLEDEYNRLFASVFSNPADMKCIIEALSRRHRGYTRQELSEMTGLVANGAFSKMLKALVASDFVVEYVPFGCSKRDVHYKLTDAFCWFNLRFVKGRDGLSKDFWAGDAGQNVVAWRGIAFEEVCFNHVSQLKAALGIGGVQTKQSAWAVPGDEEAEGTQMDLVIERNDHIVNMCEMKFYNDDYCVTKDYERKLVHRQHVLAPQLAKRTVIHNTLVTTYGLKYNEYSGAFQNVVTLEDLFKE